MNEHRQSRRVPSSASASVFSSQDTGVTTAPESTDYSGTGTMSFTNPTSAPWPSTALSVSQESEVQRFASDPSPSVNIPLNAYAPDIADMNDDGSTIDPRHLMLDLTRIHYPHDLQSNPDGAQLQAQSPWTSRAVTSYDPTTLSPLRRTFETLELQGPSPSSVMLPNPVETSLSGAMMSQQDSFYPMSSQHEGFSNELFRQHHTGMVPQVSSEPDAYEMMRNTGSYPGIADRCEDSSLSRFIEGQLNVPQGEGSDLYHEHLASIGYPVRPPVNPTHSAHQRAEAPEASSSSLKGKVVPGSARDSSSQSSNSPATQKKQSRHATARTIAPAFLSTGDGLDTRMYYTELAGVPRPGSDAISSEPVSTAVVESSSGPNVAQAKSDNKGKGKLILLEEDERPSRALPSNEPSSSSKKKRGGLIKTCKRTLKTILPRRAARDRPKTIVCPFAECGESIPNLHGSTRQHVDGCCSTVVRAVRDSHGRSGQGTKESSPKIRCPTCRGKREFYTLSRWADHLTQMHGEWIRYECEVEGCDARFVSVRDRNEHRRLEHQHE